MGLFRAIARRPAAIPLQFEGGTLSFSSEFTFQITGSGGSLADDSGVGADGIIFAIVNSPTVTGNVGGGLGYQGIGSSVAVEFDTWNNTWDPNGNHIGIDVNGSVTSLATVWVGSLLQNGAVWHAWVDYIGGAKTLEVRLAQTPDRPVNPNLTRVLDIPAILGSNTAFMGFTSGTGADWSDHDIRSWKVRVFGEGVDVAFASPVGDFSVMARNTGGGFSRILKDGVAMEFDADGRQTSETDPNGNRTDYIYNAQGQLHQIVKTPGDLTTTFVYNAASQLETITDPAGRVTAYTYDPLGTLLKVTNPDGSMIRYRYTLDGARMTDTASARGFVTTQDYGFAGQWIGSGFPDGTSVSASISGSLGLSDFGSGLGTEGNPDTYVPPEDRITMLQDAKGNIYETEVNKFGAMVRTTDPIGRTNRFTRDEDNLVRESVRDNDGLLPDGTTPATVTTTLDYDDRGNVVSQTEAAGTTLARTTRFEYEPEFSRTIKIIDPSNSDPAPACGSAGVTCFEYDEFGNMTTVTDALGGQQVFTHLANGLKFTARDANLNLTQFFYDLTGNLTQVIDGAGSESRLAYDAAGNVESQTEGFGTSVAQTYNFTFDEMGRVRTQTNPDSGLTDTRYDASGNTVVESDATGIAVTSTYDQVDRLKSETHPATGTVTRVYDENGNLKSTIDPTGEVEHFSYDAVNRVVRTEDPAGGVRVFTYDLRDNPVQVTDANGNATYFKHDVHGREVERSNALGNTWTFVWDSRDNKVEAVDAAGQTINKTFDELSRITVMELVEADGVTVGDIVTFGYDSLGHKTSAVDSDSSLAWSYDEANRVATAETLAAGAQPAVLLTHAYDAVGNRATLTHGPDGVIVDGTWSYLHEGDGNLTRITTPTTEIIDLFYDAASRLERITSASTVEMQVLYDADTGRPGSIAHRLGAATLAGFDYGFDTDGKILSIADSGGTRSFTYDATLQLTGGGYASAPESYAYDAESNRTSSHLSASYSHDAANRLREDADNCYDYDANGNLVGKRVKIGLDCVTDTSGATTTYEWDVLNRLVRINFADDTFAAYRYDAQGRRIGKDVNGSITRYVYDGDAILLEYDGANTLIARYSHGEEIDLPLAMERGGTSYFYHTDHLGSIRLVTGAAGTVANRYDYDAFGNLEATSFETVTNPYTLTARERDAESGLMFYRARYYDPRIGRFISEDPIRLGSGEANFYRYARNNPIMWSDPSGLIAATEEFGTSVVGVGSAGSLRAIGATLAETFWRLSLVLRPNLVPASITAGGIIILYNSQVGSSGGSSARPAPLANQGDCPPHGGDEHWRIIQELVAALRADPTVINSTIRVNQTQVNSAGSRVGNNRPDIQYTRTNGKQHTIEFTVKNSDAVELAGVFADLK